MNTIQLKNIYLSDEIMTASQVSDFTEETYEHKGYFIHLSGDKNIGTLELSGNVFGGNNTIKNTETLSNTIVFGNDNQILGGDRSAVFGQINTLGQNGYKIISCDTTETITVISIDTTYGNVDFNALNQLKPRYSLESTINTINYGTVIESNENTISVTRFSSVGLQPTAIYFPKHQEIGNYTVHCDYSLIAGNNNIAAGTYNFVCGRNNIVNGNYAYVEGKSNVASWGAHTEGAQNFATGVCSHAEGRYNQVSAHYAHSSNAANIASGTHSKACGFMSYAKDARSFVWNGELRKGYQGNPAVAHDDGMWWNIPDTTIPPADQEGRTLEYVQSDYMKNAAYKSHEDGSFNINPANGISGFYVGEDSLYQILQKHGSSSPLSGTTYSKSTDSIEFVLYDIAQKLGATITD